jgi:type VI secretion system protein ImpJ
MMAKPNIQLRTEFDALDQMSCLRLVKIQRQYDGEFKIIHDIIPASLTLNAIPSLRDIAQATCDMVANLIREFAKTREKIGDISSYSSTELSDFLFNKELAILLPDLRANLEQSTVHPYTLYGQLAKLHQHCATFLAPEYLDRVPAYQHDCLEEVLPALVMQIRGMLSSKKERPEDKIEMKALSPGRFESSQIPRHALENFNFYLAVDAKQDSADWIPRFPQLVKLAAPEQLETVIASGLPGVTLQHIQRLPQKIRIKSGYEYFQISTESDLWNAVLQAQQFAVFCMGEFADATIELIVMDEK